MKMEIFMLEPEKPTLEKEMEDQEYQKKWMDSCLPVTPADEFYQNKNTEGSKGKIINLTGKY